MKTLRALLVAALAFAAISIGSSQGAYFDVGIKGAYGITMMANKNVFDDRGVDHKLSGGYLFGVNLGVHFKEIHGVIAEYNRAWGKQKFELDDITQTLDYEWITNDAILLYKLNGNGGFFEIGPKVSFVDQVTRITNSGEPVDVTEYFEDKWYSGVLGFGTYLAGSDVFTIQIGIRLHYQFNDMINDRGQELLYPVDTMYDTYKKSSQVMAQVHLEATYAFGRFAKRSCRDRWKLILF